MEVIRKTFVPQRPPAPAGPPQRIMGWRRAAGCAATAGAEGRHSVVLHIGESGVLLPHLHRLVPQKLHHLGLLVLRLPAELAQEVGVLKPEDWCVSTW